MGVRDAGVLRRTVGAGSVGRAAKRTLDIVLGLLLLVVLAPILALLVLAIRLDSSGGPLFRQTRVGRDGRRFRCVKFRTMVVDAEQQVEALREQSRDPNWLDLEHDPRITRVGRWLRHTSLDELPQLWNVLRGQMSIVGPRPLSVEDDSNVPSWARIRSAVPPGMTGLWQVSGRTDVSFADMLRLDCEYAANWSLHRDLALIVRTVPAVLFARGAN